MKNRILPIIACSLTLSAVSASELLAQDCCCQVSSEFGQGGNLEWVEENSCASEYNGTCTKLTSQQCV